MAEFQKEKVRKNMEQNRFLQFTDEEISSLRYAMSMQMFKIALESNVSSEKKRNYFTLAKEILEEWKRRRALKNNKEEE
jgi:hypothetical protein